MEEEPEEYLRHYFSQHQNEKNRGSTDVNLWIAHLKALSIGDLETFASELKEYERLEATKA